LIRANHRAAREGTGAVIVELKKISINCRMAVSNTNWKRDDSRGQKIGGD